MKSRCIQWAIDNCLTANVVSQLTIILLLFCYLLSACHGRTSGSEEEARKTITPVTVTKPIIGSMQEEIELNAVSTFLRKNQIKATTNGYLIAVNVLLGQKVVKGQTLFVLKGKEAENLGAVINDLDTTVYFTGEVKTTANSSGFITNIFYQTGDYVQEGDVLAEISDVSSLVFLMQLPYELKAYLSKNKTLNLELPGGQVVKGTVSSAMPMVDPVSQTQGIVIRINNSNGSIPENLIAKVRLIQRLKDDTISLPKAAVLADETQEHFWIMKMTGENTAVKVPIKKGIVSAGMIEIVSPKLSPDDVILKTGNYGLPDTARVAISN